MRVLYVQYTNPGAYPPLVRGAQLLADAGAEVLMLGTRVAGTNALQVPAARGITVRLMPEAPGGWRLKAHYARYAAWVAAEAVRWKPDWIYASDLLSAPVAVGLAMGGARVVYHEHDAPALDGESWFVKRCAAARRKLLTTATIVVAPNADRAARLAECGGGRRTVTVWNCPRRPSRKPAVGPSGDRLRVLYCGSVNSERLPLATIEAIVKMDRMVTLDVAGYETAGSRGYLDMLASHADRLGVASRVRILGTVAQPELTGQWGQHDVGLALMPMTSGDENMRHMTGASNKVFEYLASGAAPLVTDLPDWRRVFVEPGYAFACDPGSPSSIADALTWACDHRAAIERITERGWSRLCSDWNYESQFAPVLAAMCGGSPAGGGATGSVRAEAAESGAEVECAS